jgi:chemotaxis protein CheD
VVDRSNLPVELDYFLKPGYIFVPSKPALISAVLGSCVAVCLWDRKRKVGGMNHFQFPATAEQKEATAVFGNVATFALIRMMTKEGSKVKHLEAQIFGGAHDPGLSLRNVGRENIRAARKVLNQARIKIVSEDVGGERGRKIVFNTATNEVAVLKVERLRKSDWFPYESE